MPNPDQDRRVVSKVRVYELAKELGVESKDVLAKLQELGEFVRSASSTIEATVARRLKEAMPAAPGKAPANKATAKKAPAAKAPQVPSAAEPVAPPTDPPAPPAAPTRAPLPSCLWARARAC